MARLAHIISRPDGSFESWSETLPDLTGVDSDQLTCRSRQELVQPCALSPLVGHAALVDEPEVDYALPAAYPQKVLEPIDQGSVRKPVRKLVQWTGGHVQAWRGEIALGGVRSSARHR